MRSLRALIAVAGLAFAASACVTDAPPLEQPDAAVPDPPDAMPIPDAMPVMPDATPLCENAVTPISSSRHSEPDWAVGGQGCMGGCHNGQGDVATLGRPLTLGGSVYRRKTIDPNEGNNPFVAGAHIYVIDANGKLIDMITHQDGKFSYEGEVAFPIRTWASGCPDSIPMEASTTGNCNSGGCHDQANRIYLPSEFDPPAP